MYIYIYIIEVRRGKKILKSADVRILVISRGAFLKIFDKNELKNTLTKFHDFVRNLKYLALSNLTKKVSSK